MDVLESLRSHGIFLARYHFGQHAAPCPVCSPHRRKKHDPCLSVLIDGQGATWNCHHCGWKAGAAGKITSIPIADPDRYGAADRTRAARALWADAAPIHDTQAQWYLVERGITLAPPPTLRFASNLYHAPSGRHLPALVAAVQNSAGRVTAIQRIYLRGHRKAPVRPAKMTLGAMGDGAVRLAKPAGCLGIAEGIETALAATQLFGIPCWAALGTRFEAVRFPTIVTTIVAFADNGRAGEEAVAKLQEKHGRAVKVIPTFPPAHYGDFNEVLQDGGGDEARRRL